MKPRAVSSSAVSSYFSRNSVSPCKTRQMPRGATPSGTSQNPVRNWRLSGAISVLTRKFVVTGSIGSGKEAGREARDKTICAGRPQQHGPSIALRPKSSPPAHKKSGDPKSSLNVLMSGKAVSGAVNGEDSQVMASIDFDHRGECPAGPRLDGLGLSFFISHLSWAPISSWVGSCRPRPRCLYLLLLPAIMAQWYVNHGSCVMNNFESWLRSGRWRDPSNPEEGGLAADAVPMALRRPAPSARSRPGLLRRRLGPVAARGVPVLLVRNADGWLL